MNRPYKAGGTHPIEPDPVEVQEQLERILDSSSFRTSKRCSDFLRYVVENRSDDSGESLKERSVGIAVFERPPDYDTNQDPVVRSTAGQVRKRLAQYYLEPGHASELRIDLPAGSYAPEIRRTSQPAAPVPVSEPPASPKTPRFPGSAIVAAGLVVLAALVFALATFGSRDSALDSFWNPLWKDPATTVLCVGQGHTYKLGNGWDQKFEDAASQGGSPGETSIPVRDIIPAWDRYVSLSDTQALLRLTSLFTRHQKEVTLRGGRLTSFNDLRGKPVVLVGALNNDWTLNLTGELRFYFESDPKEKLDLVRDRQRPDFRQWAVRSDLPPSQVSLDYAIVTRVLNHTTEHSVVVAAGIKGGGTAAAGEFLTNESYLNDALRSAPKGWEKKNVQFVLAARLFNGTPGPPTVVASHFW